MVQFVLENKFANRIRKLIDLGITLDNLLYFPFILEEFDENTIKNLLNEMKPENWLIFFSSKTNDEITDQTEVIYNTKFSCWEIDEQFIEELSWITFDMIGQEGEYLTKIEFDYPPK